MNTPTGMMLPYRIVISGSQIASVRWVRAFWSSGVLGSCGGRAIRDATSWSAV